MYSGEVYILEFNHNSSIYLEEKCFINGTS